MRLVNFRRRGLTLNEDYNVDPPCASCQRYHGPLPVPNGEAGGDRECLSINFVKRADRRIRTTYMRSTIKKEAVAIAKYPKV
jgi:hypothetical protein